MTTLRWRVPISSKQWAGRWSRLRGRGRRRWGRVWCRRSREKRSHNFSSLYWEKQSPMADPKELERARQPPSAKSICSRFSRGCTKCLLPVRILKDANRLRHRWLGGEITNQEIRRRALTHDQEAASSIEDPDDPPDEDSGDEDAETPRSAKKTIVICQWDQFNRVAGTLRLVISSGRQQGFKDQRQWAMVPALWYKVTKKCYQQKFWNFIKKLFSIEEFL